MTTTSKTINGALFERRDIEPEAGEHARWEVYRDGVYLCTKTEVRHRDARGVPVGLTTIEAVALSPAARELGAR